MRFHGVRVHPTLAIKLGSVIYVAKIQEKKKVMDSFFMVLESC